MLGWIKMLKIVMLIKAQVTLLSYKKNADNQISQDPTEHE